MFKNYSQTYAANITALAGFVVIMLKGFGFDIAESDAAFVIGVLFNVGGIVWALYHRNKKGDVKPLGGRK